MYMERKERKKQIFTHGCIIKEKKKTKKRTAVTLKRITRKCRSQLFPFNNYQIEPDTREQPEDQASGRNDCKKAETASTQRKLGSSERNNNSNDRTISAHSIDKQKEKRVNENGKKKEDKQKNGVNYENGKEVVDQEDVSNEKEGQEENYAIRKINEKEGEKRENVVKRSYEKEGQTQEGATKRSDEKEGQNEEDVIKRSDEKEGQNEEDVIKSDDEEGQKQEDVIKISDVKEDQNEQDMIDNSDEKKGQKEGDLFVRSVGQQHDFDSMKGNANEIPDPEEVSLPKRMKVRLKDILRNCMAQVNCSFVIIIHDFLFLCCTTGKDSSSLVYKDI